MAVYDSKKMRRANTGFWLTAEEGTPRLTEAELKAGVEAIIADGTWKTWGLLATEGVGEALSQSTEDVKVFQDNMTVDTIVTDSSGEFTVPSVEVRKEIIETVHATTVASNGAYTIDLNASRPHRECLWATYDRRSDKWKWQQFTAQVVSIADVNNVSTETAVCTPTFKVFGGIFVIDEFLAEETPAAPETP